MRSVVRAATAFRIAKALALSAACAACAALWSCGGSGTTRQVLNAVAFSPDGKKVLVGGTTFDTEVDSGQIGSSFTTYQGLVRLFDASTGRFLGDWGIGGGVSGVAWSPLAIAFFSADQDAAVSEFKGDTAHFQRQFTDGSRGYWCVAVSPDDSLVAGGSQDGVVRLWNTESGAVVRRLSGHTEGVRSIAFSPDGRSLASAGWRDDTFRLWDVGTGASTRTIEPGISETNAVCWSPDGKSIAVAGGLACAVVDAGTGEVRLRLSGQFYGLYAVAWSPDGKAIATGAGDSTTVLWNARTGAKIRTLDSQTTAISGVDWSPDGSLLATAGQDGRVRVWDSATGALRWSQ